MNKIKGLLLVVVLFFISSSVTYAATCDTAEENRLRSLAVKVEMSYKEAQEELPEGSYTPPDGLPIEEYDNYVGYRTYFEVKIANLTEELYVEVKNKNTGKTTTYHYSDSNNGVITFSQDIYEMNNYTMTVYAVNTACGGKKLATSSLKTPRYNEFSEYEFCISAPEYYMCNMYVDYELPEFNEFVEKVSKYISDKEKNREDEEKKKEENSRGFSNFLKENKVAIGIIVVIIIGAGVGATVVIIRRRQRRVV